MKLKTAFIFAGTVAAGTYALSKYKEWKETSEGNDYLSASKLSDLFLGVANLDAPEVHLAKLRETLAAVTERPSPFFQPDDFPSTPTYH